MYSVENSNNSLPQHSIKLDKMWKDSGYYPHVIQTNPQPNSLILSYQHLFPPLCTSYTPTYLSYDVVLDESNVVLKSGHYYQFE